MQILSASCCPDSLLNYALQVVAGVKDVGTAAVSVMSPGNDSSGSMSDAVDLCIHLSVSLILLCLLIAAVTVIFRLRSEKQRSEKALAKKLAAFAQKQNIKQADIPQHMQRLGSWTYDGQRDVVVFSEGLCAMLGIPFQREPISLREAFLFVDPQDKGDVIRAFQDSRLHRLGFFKEHRLRKANGDVVFVEHYAETRSEAGHDYVNGCLLYTSPSPRDA